MGLLFSDCFFLFYQRVHPLEPLIHQLMPDARVDKRVVILAYLRYELKYANLIGVRRQAYVDIHLVEYSTKLASSTRQMYYRVIEFAE